MGKKRLFLIFERTPYLRFICKLCSRFQPLLQSNYGLECLVTGHHEFLSAISITRQ